MLCQTIADGFYWFLPLLQMKLPVISTSSSQDLESLQKWGAFDGWIGFTTPPTSHFGIADTNYQVRELRLIKAPRQPCKPP